MPLSDILPFLGIRKLFDPNAYSGSQDDPNSPSLIPSVGNAPDPSNDEIGQLTKILLDRINQPNQNLDRLNQLYQDFPTRTKPSVLRRIGAGFVGVGYGPKAAKDYLDDPFNQQLEDWQQKTKLAENIAGEDIKGQQNTMSDAVRGIGALVNQQKQESAQQNEMSRLQNEVNKTANALKVAEDKLGVQRDNQDLQKQYHDAALANQKAIADLRYETLRGDAERRVSAAQALATQKAWQPITISDPNDPTKQITARMNTATGKVERITLDNQPIGPAEKLGIPSKTGTVGPNGQPLTAQTRGMMELAQMIYPSIDDVRKQAIGLDKRKLFGVVMSRVRDLAAKIGTVGDAQTVGNNMTAFASTLASDPKLNPSGDAAVGEFLTKLGLLASGAGRVHAQGRTGIQMINYMKGLLTSDSTLDMFMGRLKALDSTIKQYAEGPPKAKVPTELDKVIDDILSGGKK